MRHAFSVQASAGLAHLRLMATTDLHVHVLAYDYYADQPCDRVGLSQTAALITDARAQAANSLLLDNGDFLQGNPLGDYIAQQSGRAADAVHPIFAAMNLLGYDAATLGNHEFNYGLEFLLTALTGAAFPVVSANIARKLGPTPEADQTLIPPYVILDRQITDGAGTEHPIRIGLIGFVPPQVTQWDRVHLAGKVVTRDIVETARALVPRMKAEGADIIIALSHSGIGAAEATQGMEDASTALAHVPGIDALVTGHSHLVFPSASFAGVEAVDHTRGTLGGKPAVMAGFFGSHLGLIDLLLERSDAGWRVADFAVEARAIRAAEAEKTPAQAGRSPRRAIPEVEAAVRDDHGATLHFTRRSIGRTAVPLNSYFALVSPSPAVQLVAEAQAAHVARHVAGTPDAALPILSAAAPFKFGGRGGPRHFTDVPVGEMALRHAADLYIFPNSIAALRLNGAEVADWLERAVGIYNCIEPGLADQPLIDPDFPCYNFDLIHGVSFQIDLSQPARFDRQGKLLHPTARRIRNLTWAGAEVAPDARFILATNSYRASGSGGFPGTTPAHLLWCSRNLTRDIVVRHVAEAGVIHAPETLGWSFVPMQGTSVTFETSPQASPHVPDLGPQHLTPLGPTDDGFVRFRLTL
nr:bifunctional 2',3'-cyclic-nucleotide 2'-phosphodiesterase/3'-nucleotidase [Rhodobacter sp. SW2]